MILRPSSLVRHLSEHHLVKGRAPCATQVDEVPQRSKQCGFANALHTPQRNQTPADLGKWRDEWMASSGWPKEADGSRNGGETPWFHMVSACSDHFLHWKPSISRCWAVSFALVIVHASTSACTWSAKDPPGDTKDMVYEPCPVGPTWVFQLQNIQR